MKISLKISYKEKHKSLDSRKIILHKKLKESRLHLALKILSYLYFWEKNLVLEPTYRFRKYRPDLIALKKEELPHLNDLTPKIWIECKKVKIKKLISLGRYLSSCQIIWFHKMEILSQIKRYSLIKQKYKLPANVQLIGVKISPLTWNYLLENITRKQQIFEVTRFNQNNILITFPDQQVNPVEIKYQILTHM